MKRLTARQRDILAKLSRRDGQRQFWLGPSHSGNVIENLLAHDLVRVDVRGTGNIVFITIQGREALRTGRLADE